MDKNYLFVGIAVILVISLIGFGSAAVTTTTWTNGEYTIVKFNGTGTTTWTKPAGVTAMYVLYVAGGGGGGTSNAASDGGGGGGAGGMKYNYSYNVSALTGDITVGVGNGGASHTAGGDSNVSGTGITTLTVSGGGRGAATGENGGNGGSGGGAGVAASSLTGGTGTSGQGAAGGNNYASANYGVGGGGGGGIAGTAGGAGTTSSSGWGGNGTSCNITGSNVTYAGGGGSGAQNGRTAKTGGGSGGGGYGGDIGSDGVAGTNDYGGGGGGSGGKTGGLGGVGGSGVVIFNYTTPLAPVANFTKNTSSGFPPLYVQFNDTSTNTPTGWTWNFGDGVIGNYTPAAVNLLTYSQRYDNAAWTKSKSVVTANQTIAPDLTNRGAIFADNGSADGNTLHYNSQAVTLTKNTNVTASIYAKALNRTWMRLVLYQWDGTNYNGTYFDMGNGTIGSNTTGSTATMTNVGNGWYRCSIVVPTGDGATTPVLRQYIAEKDADITFTGNGSWNIYAWGSQVEYGSSATPYYATNDDIAMVFGKNITHTYTNSGTYNVNLIATNSAGSNTSSNQTIEVGGAPVASFTMNVTGGNIPFYVQFNDTSTNTPTAWYWDFADGSGTSDIQNPVYQYTTLDLVDENNNLTPTLQAENAAGNNATFRNLTLLDLQVSQFTNVTSGYLPLGVMFNDTSTGSTTSYYWNFNDGNTSTTRNISHIFYTAGTYAINHSATNAYGTKWNNTTVIQVNTPAPVADFHANATTGTAPKDIQFTDDSTNVPTSWAWSWGDATANGTTQNPLHTYNNAGTYTVIMTATNAGGSSVKQRTSYITISPAPTPPTAAFSGTPLSGERFTTVTFTDASTGSPTSWYWDFGDSSTSTTQSPTHQYTTTGSFTVKLDATNAYGNDWENKTNYITIADVTPVAAFGISPSSGGLTTTFTFTDASTHYPTSWNWSFGDGTANSTTQSPTHQYSSVGIYTINLTATNAAGSSSVAHSVTVSAGVLPHRVEASETVAPISTQAYYDIMQAIGGNTSNENATINFTQMANGVMDPYTSTVGPIAWLIALSIPIVMIWIVQGKAYIPLIIGVILAGTLTVMGWIPAEYTLVIDTFIGMCIAGIVVSLYIGRKQ